MPSPFPGMNPYLEQEGIWQHFHVQFCARCMETLVPQVRPDFFVKLEEHIYIHELGETERVWIGRSDISLGRTGVQQTAGAAAVASIKAPVEVRLPFSTDVERVPYIEIRDRVDRSLVTVLELLSPANKRPGSDRQAFLAKREELLRSNVNYVEIDLLRGGPRLPLEEAPTCDYYVLVSRAEERPATGMWPLALRDPLPTIPVPLRPPHADARLDLQALLQQMYDAAGYEDYIYAGQPQPWLREEDEVWAKGLLGGGE